MSPANFELFLIKALSPRARAFETLTNQLTHHDTRNAYYLTAIYGIKTVSHCALQNIKLIKNNKFNPFNSSNKLTTINDRDYERPPML